MTPVFRSDPKEEADYMFSEVRKDEPLDLTKLYGLLIRCAESDSLENSPSNELSSWRHFFFFNPSNEAAIEIIPSIKTFFVH